jgi:hypothetical protein
VGQVGAREEEDVADGLGASMGARGASVGDGVGVGWECSGAVVGTRWVQYVVWRKQRPCHCTCALGHQNLTKCHPQGEFRRFEMHAATTTAQGQTRRCVYFYTLRLS